MFDVITRHASKDALIVEIIVEDTLVFDRVLDMQELKELRQQLEDAEWLIKQYTKES